MELYNINNYSSYKVNDSGQVYSFNNSVMVKVGQEDNGGYILLHNKGTTDFVSVRTLMKLADLPYNRSMVKKYNYVKELKKTQIRRDLEDILWEKDNDFSF